MSLGTYRRLILICAVWAALSIPSTVVILLTAMSAEGTPGWSFRVLALPIGLAFLPLSAFGLWNMRLWGFVVLVVGFVFIATVYPYTVHLHAICIALTIIQYFTTRNEARRLSLGRPPQSENHQ